jgi:Rieske Fe-S protein
MEEAIAMKALTRIGVALTLVLGLMAAGTLSAEETTLKGTMKCGKCALKKADKCQDVLVVSDAAGATTEYWIVKNEAAEKAGHQCQKEAAATVTGEVSEKDGKKWVTASKIEKT